MKGYKSAAMWMTGLLIGIFALSIVLSWYNFGYLDLETVVKMGLLLVPIAGATVVILLWPERQRVGQTDTQPGTASFADPAKNANEKTGRVL